MSDRRRAATGGAAILAATGGRPGFTLLELLLVLAIMATLSALVVPNLAASVRRGELRSTAGNLKELLSFAYSAAVTRRRPVEVNLDPSRRQCVVLVRETTLPWLKTASPEPPQALAPAEARVLKSFTWPEGIRVEMVARGQPVEPQAGPSRADITFQSTGQVDDATIEISNPEGSKMTLQVGGPEGPIQLGGQSKP